MTTDNFPLRFRNLWHSATALLHAVNALQTKASDAIRSGVAFTWPNEPTPGFIVSRREFCEVLDVTHDRFLCVRNEATSPWVRVTELLSLGNRTEWALSVLLENQRQPGVEVSPDQRSQLDEAREVLRPPPPAERAVALECIHAEIRQAISQITPRFNPELPGDFIYELLCAKDAPMIAPEAREWIEAHISAVERQVHDLTHPAPQLEFAECPPLDFVGHIGLFPLGIQSECVELRRILAESDNKASRLPPQPADPVASPATGKVPAAFADLERWAKAEMKGIQLMIVELVMANGGSKPLLDLAIHDAIRWCGDDLADDWAGKWESARREITKKIKRVGWRLIRLDNCAILTAHATDKKPTEMSVV